MEQRVLRILIVEDTFERQKILRDLYKGHAWILVNTVNRAICLLDSYDFDLISLDFDLPGGKKADEVASFIHRSRNAKAKVIIHAMNNQGAKRILEILPNAEVVPLSKMIRNNTTFKRLQQELSHGVDINWVFVFDKKK
jgi:CheY-like chemotaxis protein